MLPSAKHMASKITRVRQLRQMTQASRLARVCSHALESKDHQQIKEIMPYKMQTLGGGSIELLQQPGSDD